MSCGTEEQGCPSRKRTAADTKRFLFLFINSRRCIKRDTERKNQTRVTHRVENGANVLKMSPCTHVHTYNSKQVLLHALPAPLYVFYTYHYYVYACS